MKEKRKYYIKEDLVFFTRESCFDVTSKYYANELIKEDKNYCFFGIFNKDKTKVKDILTGKVYNALINRCSEGKGKDKFIVANFSDRQINCEKNCDAYLVNQIEGDMALSQFYDAFTFDSISVKHIRTIVKELNEEIHCHYKDAIKKVNIENVEKAKKSKLKLSDNEREF